MDDPTNPGNTQPTPSTLSIDQENAIDLLIQGQNDRQVAEAIGVTRQTVCDWRNHNPDFAAELAARRADYWGAHTGRLRHIASAAIDVLAADLTTTKFHPTEGDRRIRQAAAVQILKAGGYFRQAPGATAKPEQFGTQTQAQTPEHDPLDLFYDFPPGI